MICNIYWPLVLSVLLPSKIGWFGRSIEGVGLELEPA
jgi:hypothetical protein